MLAIDISCRFLSVTKGISIQVASATRTGFFGIDMCTLLSSQGASAHQNPPNLATRPILGQPDKHYTRPLHPAQRGPPRPGQPPARGQSAFARWEFSGSSARMRQQLRKSAFRGA